MAPIFQTNLLGYNFAYAFGPANGLVANVTYTVVLLFCKLYFETANQRTFSVTANGGQALLQNLDIFAAAGDCMPQSCL
jgi:hypothetical protein